MSTDHRCEVPTGESPKIIQTGTSRGCRTAGRKFAVVGVVATAVAVAAIFCATRDITLKNGRDEQWSACNVNGSNAVYMFKNASTLYVRQHEASTAAIVEVSMDFHEGFNSLKVNGVLQSSGPVYCIPPPVSSLDDSFTITYEGHEVLAETCYATGHAAGTSVSKFVPDQAAEVAIRIGLAVWPLVCRPVLNKVCRWWFCFWVTQLIC